MNLIAKLKYLLNPHRKHRLCIKQDMLPALLEKGKWYSISFAIKKDEEMGEVLDNFTITQLKVCGQKYKKHGGK